MRVRLLDGNAGASGSPLSVVWACLLGLLVALAPARGVAAGIAEDERVFPVGDVTLRFAGGAMDARAPDLLPTVVAFGVDPEGLLTDGGNDAPTRRLAVGEIGDAGVELLTASGIRTLLSAVRGAAVERTGQGAYVVPDPKQMLLAGGGSDLRDGGTSLTILIYTTGGMTPQRERKERISGSIQGAASQRHERRAGTFDAKEEQAGTPDVRLAVMSQPDEPALDEPPTPVEPRPRAGATPAEGGADTATSEVIPVEDVPLSDVSPTEEDGARFRMTGFVYSYVRPHPDLPPAEEIDSVFVRLVRTSRGFVDREGEGSLVRLGDLGSDRPVFMYQSAIIAAERAVVRWFREEHSIAGVYVAPDVRRIDSEVLPWEDYREEMTAFPLEIYSAQVSSVKTIASGERIATENRLNSPKHARIRRHSPLEPSEAAGGPTGDLLRLEPLNRYAFQLSRHPGREVNVAVANASDPEDPETLGNAEVQYLVQETKPWTAYFQLSNTGTEETAEWRERFGLVHNQLIGFDDILTLDYITGNFDETHAFVGRYDVPLHPTGRVRLALTGAWSEYEASDVGVQDERFDGSSWQVGTELVVNVFQLDDFFVDAYGGVRYQDIEVINRGLDDGRGNEQIFVPRVGLRAERRRAAVSFGADLGLSFSANGVTDAEQEELERLGRLDPDRNWVVLNLDTEMSFYIDAIAEWSERPSRYAHEIATQLSAQYAFNNRLIPNEEIVGGGLYTVRGYPESTVAADSGVFFTAEYRFHIPRALPASDTPPTVFGEPFRVVPDGQGGRPDWDLIFKVFLDAGRIENSRRLGFERDESLLSTGVGGELVIADNLSFRTDWGIVLDEVGSDTPDEVTVGSTRWHFVLTLLY